MQQNNQGFHPTVLLKHCLIIAVFNREEYYISTNQVIVNSCIFSDKEYFIGVGIVLAVILLIFYHLLEKCMYNNARVITVLLY